MMKQKDRMKYYSAVFVSVVLSIGVLVSCGVQDSVILLPEDRSSADGSPEGSGGESEPEHLDADRQTEQESEEQIPTVFIYVCGAVVEPQVVELPEGSRARDALEAAGGFFGDAHREYVNLAEKVTDGQKLYFPTMEEVKLWEEEAQNKKLGLVNINTAGLEELMTLPGIGEARAKDILSYREEHGAFEQKEDLQKVPGIKENMYAKLCDKIFVR